MGHESREEFFPYLKEKLGDVPFFIDKGKPGDQDNLGMWGNCRRAWLAFDPTAEWHFVLQEDSIICQDFHTKLKEVLEKIGKQDFVISLYTGDRAKEKIKKAVRRNEDHLILYNILNENALGMRTKHILQMVAYCDFRNASNDKFIQTFARRNNLPTYHPLPSLIDHRATTSLYRTLYKQPNPEIERRAVWFSDNKYENT